MRRQPQIIEPGPGQESCWDYPRPPLLEPTPRTLEVWFQGQMIALTRGGYRVCETASPPTYYFPPQDVNHDLLEPNARQSICEWKGAAAYYDVVVGDRRAEAAAWYYPSPRPRFERIAGFIAFMPSLVDECRVDGETVRPQPGRFYGGWVTTDVTGPFKGEPGTLHW